jgi:serine/threonine protein phosphatase PrpC
VLLASGSPQVAAAALVTAAEDAGGHDNVTVIVAEVVGFGDLAGSGGALDETRVDVLTLPRGELPGQSGSG